MKHLYLLSLCLLFFSCERGFWNLEKIPLDCPVITELSPNNAKMGETITIRGSNFFYDDPTLYEITIGEEIIDNSSLIKLDNNTLNFKIPKGMPSGELQLKRKGEEEECTGENSGIFFRYNFTATQVELFSGVALDSTCMEDCFFSPTGLDVDQNGNVIVADSKNHVIRKINSADKMMKIIAGKTGDPGCRGDDINGLNAEFRFPNDVAIHPINGKIYVSDASSGSIREIKNDINYPVSFKPFVGNCVRESCPSTGGRASDLRFNNPNGIVVDSKGTLFFTDKICSRLFRVEGNFVNIEIGTNETLNEYARKGLDINETTDEVKLFIADSANGRVMKKENGNLRPLRDTGLTSPIDVAFDGRNRLFILDDIRNQVFALNLENDNFFLIAGNGEKGYREGEPLAASFNRPQGITYDKKNDILYIADTGNHVIRKITFE